MDHGQLCQLRKAEFTFQYVSINIWKETELEWEKLYLHSNMSLLIFYLTRDIHYDNYHLHSNMSLLI